MKTYYIFGSQGSELWIGSYVRFGHAGNWAARKFDAILNVGPDEPNPAVRQRLGHLYQHIRMVDGVKVDEAVLEKAVHTVAVWMSDGPCKKIYVHCHMGRNRSALVAACLYVRFARVPGAQALEYVRRCRPRALANPAMERYLMALPAPGFSYRELLARGNAVDVQQALRTQGHQLTQEL